MSFYLINKRGYRKHEFPNMPLAIPRCSEEIVLSQALNVSVVIAVIGSVGINRFIALVKT